MEKKYFLFAGGGILAALLGYKMVMTNAATTAATVAQNTAQASQPSQLATPAIVYAGGSGSSDSATTTASTADAVNAVTGSASSTDTSLQQSLVDSSTIGNIINSLQSMGSSALRIAIKHPLGGTTINITPDSALDQLNANKSMASKIIDNFTATGATLQSLSLSHDASGNISISTPQAPVYNHTDIVIPPLTTATIPAKTPAVAVVPPAAPEQQHLYIQPWGGLTDAVTEPTWNSPWYNGSS
jgi:hypothetical protein